MRAAFVVLVAFLAVFFAPREARAHKPSDAYVTVALEGARAEVRVDLALRDLDHALGLDDDGNGAITWQETKAHLHDVERYAAGKIALAAGGAPCPLAIVPGDHGVVAHSDGTYVVLRLAGSCAVADARAIALHYELFFAVDPQHRGIVRVTRGGASRTVTIAASAPDARVDLAAGGGLRAFGTLLREGIVHIWTGYDHVLFLLALLLPSVLRRTGRGLDAVPALRPALADVLRVVTAFTVAHSITLGLAATGTMTLPSRVVESAIAASVVLAAMNNLWPVLRQDRWMAAFALGLLHGFGFSSTLMDLEVQGADLLTTLFGFNLGVEIGQCAIVAVFVPLAYAARHTWAYRRLVLVCGSAVIVAVASVWLVERAFDVAILS